MAERRVRVGVVGAGTFAEECHVPGIKAHPRGEVVALCGRNRERVAAMAARLGVPDVHTDYRELVARPDLDAVTVATPDDLHLPVTLAALQAGKHVFCEKPLAMNAAEARRMTEAAERAGLVAMTAFTFRYSRALMALRQLLREGAIGAPFHVGVQVHWGRLAATRTALTWREGAAQSAAGIWADGGAHLFDAIAYALAPVREVCAQMMIVPHGPGAAQTESIDLATCLARLRLPAGGAAREKPASDAHGAAGEPSGYADREQGTVHVSMLMSRVDAPEAPSDEMQVLGTHGAARIPLTRGASEWLRLRRADGAAWEAFPLPDDAATGQPLALTRMMGAFVDAVLRGRLDPAQDPGFAAGLHAQLALDAGLRSARENRWVAVS